ncbi:MAG: glucosylceramidase [Ferruginibacter sp.]|nr:glucosylceramidase [Ferruginibacter sp.]
MTLNRHYIILAAAFIFNCGCQKKENNNSNTPIVPTITNEVDVWITNGNKSTLLEKQNTTLAFTTATNNYATIEVDSSITHQTIDGFGYTLTGGSAMLINRMDEVSKTKLLSELFGKGIDDISINYLRLSMGASDLDESVFSYNDLPTGQTDINLTNFSLSKDTINVIPILQRILSINPSIKLMASPWSAPVWMKNNGSTIGGELQPQYYSTYAKYFVKYIEAMKLKGITIDAITIQNEPQHGGNNPSMVMSASQQADFIKNHLGPAFQAANISTKIVIWDHNCDNPNYPISILNDAGAKQYIDGSAFHLYNGDISALSTVKTTHPGKNLYFTEQWTGSTGNFGGDLKWHIKNVIIGSMRNWSKNALEWNLANDPSFEPHTPGGCTQCKGALTINGSVVEKNVSYYIIAHASKFIPTGSVRIASNMITNLPNVVFLTPQGKKVMIVANETTNSEIFNIKFNGKIATTSIPKESVATLVW